MIELSAYEGTDQEVVLQFEHSLLSVSKWESKHKKAFITKEKSAVEMIDYFQDMVVTPGVDRNLVYALSPEDMEKLTNYINDDQSASKVPAPDSKGPKETPTSELIYYWLTALKIPFHPTETWHLNRLMKLVEITNFKQQPPKKRKEAEVMKDWSEINERQKAFFKTRG